MPGDRTEREPGDVDSCLRRNDDRGRRDDGLGTGRGLQWLGARSMRVC